MSSRCTWSPVGNFFFSFLPLCSVLVWLKILHLIRINCKIGLTIFWKSIHIFIQYFRIISYTFVIFFWHWFIPKTQMHKNKNAPSENIFPHCELQFCRQGSWIRWEFIVQAWSLSDGFTTVLLITLLSIKDQKLRFHMQTEVHRVLCLCQFRKCKGSLH